MRHDSSRNSAHAGGKPLIRIKLKRGDKAKLSGILREAQVPARVVLRARLLQLAADGKSTQEIAAAVGMDPRTVRRVKERYAKGGLERSLWNQPRGKSDPALNDKQSQEIVAMLCGPSPLGRARWTVRLASSEAMDRKIVPKVGRETIRVLMKNHELKPWREKNVVCAEADGRVRRKDGGRARSLRKAVGPA